MTKINNFDDALKLQDCVQILNQWQIDNNMLFNDHKFMLLQFGRNSNLQNQYNYVTPNMDNIISPSNDVRDLGVQISADGSYTDHISKVINKMKQRIGFILRTFTSRDPYLLKQLWKIYIQPLADYCSQLWSPREGGLLIRLESILESYSQKMEGLQNLNYWERLRKLKIPSMGRRYERYKIIYCHKIIHNMTDNCGLKWEYSNLFGYKFYQQKCGKFAIKRREQSFNYIGPRLYNSIPSYLKLYEDCSFDTWKLKLDKFLDSVPDNPITSRISSGLCDPHTGKPTNSLLKWIPHLNISGRRTVTETIDNG